MSTEILHRISKGDKLAKNKVEKNIILHHNQKFKSKIYYS